MWYTCCINLLCVDNCVILIHHGHGRRYAVRLSVHRRWGRWTGDWRGDGCHCTLMHSRLDAGLFLVRPYCWEVGWSGSWMVDRWLEETRLVRLCLCMMLLLRWILMGRLRWWKVRFGASCLDCGHGSGTCSDLSLLLSLLEEEEDPDSDAEDDEQCNHDDPNDKTNGKLLRPSIGWIVVRVCNNRIRCNGRQSHARCTANIVRSVLQDRRDDAVRVGVASIVKDVVAGVRKGDTVWRDSLCALSNQGVEQAAGAAA